MQKTVDIDREVYRMLSEANSPPYLSLLSLLLLCEGPVTARRKDLAAMLSHRVGLRVIKPSEKQISFAYNRLEELGLIHVIRNSHNVELAIAGR